MGVSILIANPPKRYEKKKNDRQIHKKNQHFNYILAPGTYLDRFLMSNKSIFTIQTSISTFLDPIQAKFVIFFDFSQFFWPAFPQV